MTRKTFETKMIGQTCKQLKAECYTIMLQQAKYLSKEEFEKHAKDLAKAL